MPDKQTQLQEKTYLRWYNKVGYGSGDIAGNVVYAFLSAFVMIYLTDQVGLNPGIIGTLIMVSRLFDGGSDLLFGNLIDRTRTRWGKARPWMFWAYFGCAITLVANFAVPEGLDQFWQYAWFFVAYALLNAVFFTANNIAYSSLTALITKNGVERVQMGSIRFMFAFGTSMLIQTFTVAGVQFFGGGAAGWRTIAIVYAIIGILANSLAVFSVRELSAEELAADEGQADSVEEEKAAEQDNVGFVESFKLLAANKYYLIILLVFLVAQLFTATLNMGIYFMTYILRDPNLLGVFAWAINIPLIVGLFFTPFIVKYFGEMYRVNIVGYLIGVLGRVGVIVAASMGSVPLMLLFTGIASLGMSPMQGTLNALIAEASEYTYMTKGRRIEGVMYSCTSFGVKLGGGVGTALAGWLLAFSGYVGGAEVQAESALQMISIMYLWIPAIMNAIILFLLTRLDVERANRRLKDEIAATESASGTSDGPQEA